MTRFPRTGGDGPDLGDVLLNGLGFPPHGRGWTVHRQIEPERLEVSPARAEMDRGLRRPTRTTIRFPRTGGDGP